VAGGNLTGSEATKQVQGRFLLGREMGIFGAEVLFKNRITPRGIPTPTKAQKQEGKGKPVFGSKRPLNPEAHRLAQKYGNEIKEMLLGRKPLEKPHVVDSPEVKAVKERLNSRENGYQPELELEHPDDLKALEEVPL
jgi:hypothetical protein